MMTHKQKIVPVTVVSILLASGLLHADVTTNLPTTVTGGSGTVSAIQTNDGGFYVAAKGNTISLGGFSAVGGAITSVVLHVAFTVEAGYGGTGAIRVNGINTPIIPANGDSNRVASVNLVGGGFRVDTWPEITSLAVTFNNNDGGTGQAVKFDHAYLEIVHGTPDYPPPTWSDEFDDSGPPNPAVWTFEQGFVRNQELQWYTTSNAWQEGGRLIIEGRREQVLNPNYNPGSTDWKLNRQYADYTSSSIKSVGKFSFQYGRMQVRAKIPIGAGLWPASWTLGNTGEWPSNGECDLMEYYNSKILANCARGTTTRWTAAWDGASSNVTSFTSIDAGWINSFHVWTMQWDESNVRLYVDNVLMNTIPQSWLVNPVTTWGPQYPFKQPHYLLLDLAIGGTAGGNPAGTPFPVRYEVDYVRVWAGATNNTAPSDLSLSADSLAENLPIGTVVGYLTATDPDAADVIRYSLVSGTGSTDNSLFDVAFVSGETRVGVLKTKAVLRRQDAATRSIRVRATDIEGLTHEEAVTINVVGASIANLAPTNVTNNQALLNATLLNTGNTNYLVYAYWGTSNGGTNAGAWAAHAYLGAWTNVVATNVSYLAGGLAVGQTYYYTFRATNAARSLWATNVQSFTTVTGPAGTNAYLTSLILNPAGALSPSFSSNVFNYTAVNTHGATPTVTVVNADPTATNQLIYNGTTNVLLSASASSPLTLTLGVVNPVVVRVAAPDAVTVNTYTVNMTRQPSLTPPMLTSFGGGESLSLSWPADHLGYTLQVQTNALGQGLGTNWFPVPGSDSVTATNVPIGLDSGALFYRLVYP
jgi:beta-glucanase (GH16 family)